MEGREATFSLGEEKEHVEKKKKKKQQENLFRQEKKTHFQLKFKTLISGSQSRQRQ